MTRASYTASPNLRGSSGRLAEERQQTTPADAYPLDPLIGLIELLRARQRLRAPPGTVECPDPMGADHLVGEGLAAFVLRELHVEAEHLGDDRVEQAAPLAIGVERAAQIRVAGVDLVADGVHDVLGVALDQGHRRGQPLDELALWLRKQQVSELTGRRRPDELLRVEARELPEQLARLHLEGGFLEELLRDPTDVLAEPWHRGEVDGMSGLVERDPTQEEIPIDLEAGTSRG